MNDSVSLKHKQTWQGKESENTFKKKFKRIHYEPPRILNVILAVFISFCAQELSEKQHC